MWTVECWKVAYNEINYFIKHFSPNTALFSKIILKVLVFITSNYIICTISTVSILLVNLVSYKNQATSTIFNHVNFFVIFLIIDTFFHPYIEVGVASQVICLGKNYLIIASKINIVSKQTDNLCQLHWLKYFYVKLPDPFLEGHLEVTIYFFKVYSQAMTKKDNTLQNLFEAI